MLPSDFDENHSKIISKTSLKLEKIIRPILKNTYPNYDTFIFYCNNFVKKKKVIEILKKYKIGTKNLPDAIKWHCTFYWDHALSKKVCNYSKKTRDLLNTAIAIPILVGKKISLYEKISKEISFLQDGK